MWKLRAKSSAIFYGTVSRVVPSMATAELLDETASSILKTIIHRSRFQKVYPLFVNKYQRINDFSLLKDVNCRYANRN